MKHINKRQQNPYRTRDYCPIHDYTRYRAGKKPAHQILDTACRKNEILYSAEAEENLFLLFRELDALILDNMPESLCIEPLDLIRVEYKRQTGILLPAQEVLNAYHRFTSAESGGNP